MRTILRAAAPLTALCLTVAVPAQPGTSTDTTGTNGMPAGGTTDGTIELTTRDSGIETGTTATADDFSTGASNATIDSDPTMGSTSRTGISGSLATGRVAGTNVGTGIDQDTQMIEQLGVTGQEAEVLGAVLNTPIHATSPGALAANARILNLTEQQQIQLQQIAEDAQERALTVLNEEQRQQARQFPRQQITIRQIFEQVAARIPSQSAMGTTSRGTVGSGSAGSLTGTNGNSLGGRTNDDLTTRSGMYGGGGRGTVGTDGGGAALGSSLSPAETMGNDSPGRSADTDLDSSTGAGARRGIRSDSDSGFTGGTGNDANLNTDGRSTPHMDTGTGTMAHPDAFDSGNTGTGGGSGGGSTGGGGSSGGSSGGGSS